MRNVSIVFHWQKTTPDMGLPGEWAPCVVGAFDDEQKAVAECLDEAHYIFPMTMNEPIHGDPVEHPEGYYPKAIRG